jgi:hypothetical protein
MITTQIIKEDNKPVAVILDYSEYLRLKQLEQDRIDYDSAIESKNSTKKWTTHAEMKKMLE